jgi:hypothetical protein
MLYYRQAKIKFVMMKVKLNPIINKWNQKCEAYYYLAAKL